MRRGAGELLLHHYERRKKKAGASGLSSRGEESHHQLPDPSTKAFLKEHKMKPGRVLDRAVTILKEDGIVDISSWQNSKDV